MNSRKLIVAICVGITLLAGGYAVFVSPKSSLAAKTPEMQVDIQHTIDPQAGERLMPLLAKNLDKIRLLIVANPDTNESLLRIYRDDKDNWRVQELAGYPANMERMRALLARLSQSVVLEPRTSDPDRLAELGLSGERSGLLRIMTHENGDYKPLYDVLIGQYNPSFNGTYVRAYGDDQAWLTSSNVQMSVDSLAWVDTQIMDIPAERIASVEVRHKYEPAQNLVLHREQMRDTFTLYNNAVSPDNVLVPKAAFKTATLPAMLEKLEFVDVVRKSDYIDAVPATITTLYTFDGLVIQFEIIHVQMMRFVKVQARVDTIVMEAYQQKRTGDKKRDLPHYNTVQDAAAISEQVREWYYRVPFQMEGILETRIDTLK